MKKKCFIIMPITTTDIYTEQFNDTKHFFHVLEHLFIPAINDAGMEPIPPTIKGSEVIQGNIIKKLESADLVLCDMSSLNPNVFFELGIRTALNRPVALVKDDITSTAPFDTSIIYHHTYKSSLTQWGAKTEIDKLKSHLKECMKNDSDNSLWSYFSMSQLAEVGNEAPSVERQLSYAIKLLESLHHRSAPPKKIHEPNLDGTSLKLILPGIDKLFHTEGIAESAIEWELNHPILTIMTDQKLPTRIRKLFSQYAQKTDLVLKFRNRSAGYSNMPSLS